MSPVAAARPQARQRARRSPSHPPLAMPRPALRVRPRVVAPANPSLALRHLADAQPFTDAEGDLSVSYQIAKRALDVVGALAILLLLSPVMLAILVVLSVTTKGRPLFWQTRVGYCGRHFRMCKFRTMRLDADRLKHTVINEVSGPVFKNRSDPRVTRLGRLLRKTSLDETPQLFSVLLGHMTLVGPRPLVVSEVAKFASWQRRRFAVKPGLTCLWQVSGRSNIGFTDWARMDLWYVRNQSLWTDLKLMVRTPMAVIVGRGAY